MLFRFSKGRHMAIKLFMALVGTAWESLLRRD